MFIHAEKQVQATYRTCGHVKTCGEASTGNTENMWTFFDMATPMVKRFSLRTRRI